jgi:hypothetical protein
MIQSEKHWEALANYLLLYDQIVVPTGNLQVLAVLRLMLGEDCFDELVQSKVIVLARIDQWIGYVGNGHGLSYFKIGPNPDIPEQSSNLGLAFFQPLDEAIDTALASTNPPSNPSRRVRIRKLLIDNVVELSVKEIAGSLSEETYSDILGSAHLRELFLLRNAGRSMKSLLGIGPDQVTIYSPNLPPSSAEVPEIRSVLRVGYENLLLSIGTAVGASDIVGGDGALTVLRAKGQRLGLPLEGVRAFTQIQSISGVPNIGSAFANKRLTPAELIGLRHSPHCQSLRDWFASGSPAETADETVARFVATVGQQSWIESTPAKVLRFAATTGLGFLEPVSGTIASAVDSFLLSKWFPGKSPRLFLKAAGVVISKAPSVTAPTRPSPNGPCPCGSGRKFKRCHG